MQMKSKSLRGFLGSKNFETSRQFYLDLGFRESNINPTMSLFMVDDTLAFYLQDYYVKDWIENTMMFLEVENVQQYYQEITSKQLPDTYPAVNITSIKYEDWGQEFHMLDPAGVLWHFGSFEEKEV